MVDLHILRGPLYLPSDPNFLSGTPPHVCLDGVPFSIISFSKRQPLNVPQIFTLSI